MTNKIIHFFLDNKLIALLLFLALAGWGISTAPFDWDIDFLPRDPVPVDAIPDIGDNQQIVFTEWPGRSPQDIEDQITYPLTTQLLGLPGIRTVRSNSMFGFSTINVIFDDNVEFYWSRTRILEKLNSLPGGTLPDGVQPTLGPDATGLGQIFWYTLEGYDSDGNPAGGWDLHELRTIQDYQVRLALSGVSGVAEVASIGGHIREYQVEIDPVRMHESGLNVLQIVDAVRKSNLDVGARTIEMNRAEYIVRGLGYVESLNDLEESVVKVVNNTPIRIKDVAHVGSGPAQRRGVLDKAGAEAVGGVVVSRYGVNPLEVINNVKEEIERISSGLPSKELADGTLSQVKIVPFYDRSGLIYETLGTLEEALSLQILITILVIIVMVMHLRTSFIIAALLPLAVLMSFILMKYFGVDANVVALAGIAISIGTVVDMGIVLTENMLQHMKEREGENKDVALFFGLSGTGKTTLSADTSRKLIGDDEHCWSDDGVFNIEGGCYAKAIGLNAEQEPEIYNAIKFGTVLENVIYDPVTRKVDYDDVSITQNTRAAYPIEYIPNAKIPCEAGHPNNIIFLTYDAFGVLPPVSKLTPEQAMYHFISGYTAKVAGTEMGVTEPQATFSACFGAAFLVWPPSRYAEMLAEKMRKHGSKAWLVNTGLIGGAYGTGKRINLKNTRGIINAILEGKLDNVATERDDVFGIEIPTSCPDVPSEILIPRRAWKDASAYDA